MKNPERDNIDSFFRHFYHISASTDSPCRSTGSERRQSEEPDSNFERVPRQELLWPYHSERHCRTRSTRIQFLSRSSRGLRLESLASPDSLFSGSNSLAILPLFPDRTAVKSWARRLVLWTFRNQAEFRIGTGAEGARKKKVGLGSVRRPDDVGTLRTVKEKGKKNEFRRPSHGFHSIGTVTETDRLHHSPLLLARQDV